MLIRSTLGASFGVIFSVLLFKRRAWPAFVGLGFGAGRAWEECDQVRGLQSNERMMFGKWQADDRNRASSAPRRLLGTVLEL